MRIRLPVWEPFRCVSAQSGREAWVVKLIFKRASLFLGALLFTSPVFAHHGVAGVGAAALEGPGAPVESASSSTLPEGRALAVLKLDHAAFKTVNPDPAQPESDYSRFWMAGVGYGFTPWLSAYLFLPHHAKVDEPGGFNTYGWSDVSLMGQLGHQAW